MRLKINNFVKKYKNEIIKIDEIIFTKKITFLVGNNGCGKSTLIKALLRLIKHEGNIESDKSFSYMPESPTFPIDITVDSFLRIFTNNEDEQNKLDNLLSYFHLSNKKNEKISHLSKGMKAKINLIQCLLIDADYYLLDEPFNGLDHDGIVCLIKQIKQMKSKFIIATHLTDYIKDLKGEVILI